LAYIERIDVNKDEVVEVKSRHHLEHVQSGDGWVGFEEGWRME
jgi:hypothetical protein